MSLEVVHSRVILVRHGHYERIGDEGDTVWGLTPLGRRQAGGSYGFDVNLSDGRLVQQRIGLFYHAQCCGVAFDFQTFDYGASAVAPVTRDRRFSISFTLAGLGSFSNMLGAFGIGQGATGTSTGW